jgi:hypothetical protein
MPAPLGYLRLVIWAWPVSRSRLLKGSSRTNHDSFIVRPLICSGASADFSGARAVVSLRMGLGLLLLGALPASLRAQTDYYNTDAGRPARIEDAYATERYAFELKLAPVLLERAGAGLYHWGIEPEIAYGLLPRTHLEVGLPLVLIDDAGGSNEAGVAGLELSLLHNLNAETQTLPALGLRGDVLLPVGRFAPDRAYASLTALLTRTWRFARLHLNGRYTAGASPSQTGGGADAEVDRWLAGLALDRAFPLSALLLIAEVYARQPIDPAATILWHTGAGVRFQMSPRLALDAGMGRRLTGNPAWYVTFGTAYAFGLRGLIRGVSR